MAIDPETEDIARRCKLRVDLKRQTTGTNASGYFASYELTGDRSHCFDAVLELQKAKRSARIMVCDNPDHADHGKTYVLVESVWHPAEVPE